MCSSYSYNSFICWSSSDSYFSASRLYCSCYRKNWSFSLRSPSIVSQISQYPRLKQHFALLALLKKNGWKQLQTFSNDVLISCQLCLWTISKFMISRKMSSHSIPWNYSSALNCSTSSLVSESTSWSFILPSTEQQALRYQSQSLIEMYSSWFSGLRLLTSGFRLSRWYIIYSKQLRRGTKNFSSFILINCSESQFFRRQLIRLDSNSSKISSCSMSMLWESCFFFLISSQVTIILQMTSTRVLSGANKSWSRGRTFGSSEKSFRFLQSYLFQQLHPEAKPIVVKNKAREIINIVMIREKQEKFRSSFILFQNFKHFSQGQLVLPKLNISIKSQTRINNSPQIKNYKKSFFIDDFYKQSFHQVPLESNYGNLAFKAKRKNAYACLKPIKRISASRKIDNPSIQKPLLLTSSISYGKATRTLESYSNYYSIQPDPEHLKIYNVRDTVSRIAMTSFRPSTNRRTKTEFPTKCHSNDICKWDTFKESAFFDQDI